MGTQRGRFNALVGRANCTILRGSFQCNATDDPDVTTFSYDFSGGFSVTHEGTGQFHVVIPEGWRAPQEPTIFVSNSALAAAPFVVLQEGLFNQAQRLLKIRCYNVAGDPGILTLFDPADHQHNRINFSLEFVDTRSP